MTTCADTGCLVRLLALELECGVFLTSDRVQGTVARAEGLKVTVSETG